MTPTNGQSSSSAAYDAEGPFYDYTWDKLTEDIRFYNRRLGDVRSVLDAMCGTGRVAIPLASAGIRVWGVDSSAGMLGIARARLRSEAPPVRRRVRLKRIDLVHGAAGKRLDAAIIAVYVFRLPEPLMA